MKNNNLDITNCDVTELSIKEQNNTEGGVISLAVLAIGVAWAGIGATVCWAMGVGSR